MSTRLTPEERDRYKAETAKIQLEVVKTCTDLRVRGHVMKHAIGTEMAQSARNIMRNALLHVPNEPEPEQTEHDTHGDDGEEGGPCPKRARLAAWDNQMPRNCVKTTKTTTEIEVRYREPVSDDEPEA